ncbi:PQQ-like beta-propeller repeat protein [Candidatus Fermentibacteria bacterium]|nr:PQQ-like beta-propeller repeat protein [Candidatus Fermentibacteria bacterium]
MEIISLVIGSLACGLAWTSIAGGPLDDCLECIDETPTGALLISGSMTDSIDNSSDGWLMCVSPSSGVMRWEKTIGGPGNECLHAVAGAPDGSVYAVGEAPSSSGDSDLWVIKLDADGNMVWQRTFGGELEDAGTCAVARPGGGIYAGGYTWSAGAGGCDLWVLALDPSGNEDWSKTIGGRAQDKAFCLAVTPDGNLVAGGVTFSYQSRGGDAFLTALDQEGGELWSGSWGGESYDFAMGLSPLEDGGVLAACWSKRRTCALMILDVSGYGQLRDSLVFATNDDLRAEGIRPMGAGWCVAGTSEDAVTGDKDFFAWGFDAGLDSLWLETCGGTLDEICRGMICASSGRPVLVGSSSTERGDTDGWAVCLDPAALP